MNKPRLGIFGGTYNPVHWGHVRTALSVCENLHLDKVLMIPASLPPHKENPDVTFDQRMTMLKMAIAGHPKLETSDIETQIRPSYTLKTLQALQAQSNAKLYLIMGQDSFMGLPTWYEWQNLLAYCHIVVVSRAGSSTAFPEALVDLLKTHQADTLPALNAEEKGRIYFQPLPPVAISSTEIRDRLYRGETISGLCPEGVIDYIKANHLYGASSENNLFKRGTYAD